eukprot:221682-Pleurochrysis_carterae.AAC.1
MRISLKQRTNVCGAQVRVLDETGPSSVRSTHAWGGTRRCWQRRDLDVGCCERSPLALLAANACWRGVGAAGSGESERERKSSVRVSARGKWKCQRFGGRQGERREGRGEREERRGERGEWGEGRRKKRDRGGGRDIGSRRGRRRGQLREAEREARELHLSRQRPHFEYASLSLAARAAGCRRRR